MGWLLFDPIFSFFVKIFEGLGLLVWKFFKGWDYKPPENMPWRGTKTVGLGALTFLILFFTILIAYKLAQ